MSPGKYCPPGGQGSKHNKIGSVVVEPIIFTENLEVTYRGKGFVPGQGVCFKNRVFLLRNSISFEQI